MALETGTYIHDLVPTNPTHTDPISQADAHLRLIKSTVSATFPNLSGAVTATQSDLNSVAGAATTVAGGGAVFDIIPAAGPSPGAVAVSGNLAVSGAATVASNAVVSGQAIVNGGLSVAGGAVVYGGGMIVSAGGLSVIGGYGGGTGQLVPSGCLILLPNTYGLPTGYASMGGLVSAPTGYVYIQKL